MKRVREDINEKFTEKNDPISDLKIGLLPQLKPGLLLVCIKPITVKVNIGEEDNKKIINFAIEQGWYSIIKNIRILNISGEKELHLELATYERNPENFKIPDLQFIGGEYLTITLEKFFEHYAIVSHLLNEKFTDKSDPIVDMGIGVATAYKKWKKELMNRPKNVWEFFDWTDALEAAAYYGKTEFIDYILDHKANIHDNNEQPLRSAAFKSHIDFGVKLVKKGASIKDAQFYCRKHWHNDTLKGLQRIEKALSKRVNEKFMPESDPIADMGIGKREAIKHYFMTAFKISEREFNENIEIDENDEINLKRIGIVLGKKSIENGQLPNYIQFNYVGGDFQAPNIGLKSMKGFPRKVKEHFRIDHNELTSLKYAPNFVGSTYDCRKNKKQFYEEDVKKYTNVGGGIYCW